jgi:hypothetical protein
MTRCLLHAACQALSSVGTDGRGDGRCSHAKQHALLLEQLHQLGAVQPKGLLQPVELGFMLPSKL